MAHNRMKSFEYAKEITVAALMNNEHTGPLYEDSGISVAKYFEEVYKKLSELENDALVIKND